MGVFKFDESKNVVCIVCDHVVNKERPIKLATHDDEDGQWGFLCGEAGHQMKNYMLISLTQIIDIDASVNDLYEMPMGYGATREEVGEEWKPFKQED